jgi:hypothetical protein
VRTHIERDREKTLKEDDENAYVCFVGVRDRGGRKRKRDERREK